MSEQKLYRTLEVIFVAIIVLLVIPALIVFANGNRLHRTYWRAVRRLQEAYCQQAAADLDYCVNRRPHDADALHKLSIARYYVGDHRGALEAFDTSVELDGLKQRDDMVLWHDYLRACADGALPVGMPPCWMPCYRWPRPPRAYEEARELMFKARSGSDGYREAAELFEACIGEMPGTPGDMDALWGMAIARFHAGDLQGALEALDRIRANWGKEASEEFEAVVEYVKSCVPGEPPPLDMPLVLRAAATYQEGKRQTGAGEE